MVHRVLIFRIRPPPAMTDLLKWVMKCGRGVCGSTDWGHLVKRGLFVMEDLVVGEDLILDLGLPSSLYKPLIIEAGI